MPWEQAAGGRGKGLGRAQVAQACMTASPAWEHHKVLRPPGRAHEDACSEFVRHEGSGDAPPQRGSGQGEGGGWQGQVASRKWCRKESEW